MTDKFILIEAIIPATGDPLGDHDAMVAIKEPVDALKKAVHQLGGTVNVRHSTKKPHGTAKAASADAEPVAQAPVTEAVVVTEPFAPEGRLTDATHPARRPGATIAAE